MWLGVIHHVCGEHEWFDGECSHGPLVSTEDGKTYLEKDSKAHKAVRDIIAEQRWLKSLSFYVKFRYMLKQFSQNFQQSICFNLHKVKVTCTVIDCIVIV